LWSFQTAGEINCVLAYDIDNDKQMDVLAGSDDQTLYVINGLTGESFWSYGCADDVMDVKVGDLTGDGLPNMTCITFGSNGVIYAFRTLATEPGYTVGDANGDGIIDVTDAIYVLNYLFKGGPAPDPLEAGDANCDSIVDVTDAIFILNYLFKGGPEPNC
jgi:hypothetical protein